MESGSREERVALDAQSEAVVVLDVPPSEVAHRTRLLRTNVRIEQLVCCGFIDADVLRELAVRIVLHRSTTVPFCLVHSVRQVHNHTEAHHLRHFSSRCGLQRLCHVERAVLGSAVSDGQISLHLRQVVCGSNGLCLLVHLQRCELHLRIAPCSEFLLDVSAHVVVRHGTPEVRLQRAAVAEQ